MERVCNLLRVLLGRALSQHGQEAPALSDILIDRASGRFEPRLGAFRQRLLHLGAGGPPGLLPGCGACGWDLTSLRRALLCEAQEIYARMCAEHLAEVGRSRERRGMAAALLDRLRRRTRIPARDPVGEPEPAREEADATHLRGETQHRLRHWWAQRVMTARYALFGAVSVLTSQQASAGRGIRLLMENLSAAQRKQYEKYGYFDVTGGKTGKRYRIRHGRQMNIEQLDRNGRRVCGWCFFPQGSLVAGDIMLAQKAALELFEPDALRIANRF
jgi:hypothetical protein